MARRSRQRTLAGGKGWTAHRRRSHWTAWRFGQRSHRGFPDGPLPRREPEIGDGIAPSGLRLSLSRACHSTGDACRNRRPALCSPRRPRRDGGPRTPAWLLGQPQPATARRAITLTRWARYSALAWISLLSPSSETAMSLIASGVNDFASAASISV